jgi:hypothetical protein
VSDSFSTYLPAFDIATTDNDALIPELWAQEALMLLENNLVMGNLVHRDFSSTVASYGDIVNAHRPQERTPTRKVDTDEINSTAAKSDNVPVPLNQHIYDSFIIKDGEESLSFKSLVQLHLTPTIMGIAQMIDQMLATQVYQFIGANKGVGKLGTAATAATMTSIRKVANDLRIPMSGRNFVMPTAMEMALLNADLFVSAERVGDQGTALREGSLGRKYGINCFMDQNMPSIIAGQATVAGAVNLSAGYAKGTTVLVVDGFVGELAPGSWCTIAGDMTPQMITAQTATSTHTTGITISPGLQSAVVNDAVITVVTPGAINLSAGYAAGWSKDMVIDGLSSGAGPQTGQLITIHTEAANRYGALTSKASPSITSLFLDRPLVAAAANDQKVGMGPVGDYGFMFHKNALAFVNRPLALPSSGAGALGAVASYNNLGLRVVISYDAKAQGHRVTIDLLAGVATLDARLGFPVYG